MSVAHRWVNTHIYTSIEPSHSWLLGHFGLASLYSQELLQFSFSPSFTYTTLLSHFLGTLCKWSRECNFIEFYLVTFTVLLSNISHSVRISFSMGLGLAVFVLYYLMFVNVLRFHLFSSPFGWCTSFTRFLFRPLVYCCCCCCCCCYCYCIFLPQKSFNISYLPLSYCTRHINRKRFVHLHVPIFIIIVMLFVSVLVFHRSAFFFCSCCLH